MKQKQLVHHRTIWVSGLLIGTLVWLANSGNPPNGRTGAPFDSSCANTGCHTGNSNGYGGDVAISGLPGTIEPGTTYPMSITLTPTAGTPVRGGFQLVAVDGNNANAGNLAAINPESGTEFFGGREYIDHRGPKNFGGGSVTWDFEWTSPASAAGNTIRFYFIGNFTNGNNSTSGDFAQPASAIFDFAAAPPLMAVITETNPVSCFGGADGSATVEASGGTPPYTYLWSNGQNGQTAVNLAAGNYTVTVTGSGGSGTATATASITQPTQLNTSASVQGFLSCVEPVVTATATASGGTPSYEFTWSDGQTGSEAFFSAIGTYSVTATDANGCTKVAFVTVNGNLTPPNAVAAPAPDLTCVEFTVTLNGTGSSSGPNFQYLWTTPDGNILSGSTTLNPVVNAAGTYTLMVTNLVNGCTAEAVTMVFANQTPPQISASGGNLTCTDTLAPLMASSSSSPALFSWSGPGGFQSNLQNPFVEQVGTYTVTVTRVDNGCTDTESVMVALDTLAPPVSVSNGMLNCLILADTISAFSDSTSTFSWSGPGGFLSDLQHPEVALPGNYSVTVTNPGNGCTSTDTAVVTQNITPPLASAVSPEEITCADPQIQLNGTGSSQGAGFTYQWSTNNGNIVGGETTLTPVVDTVGSYVLVVTNGANGCTAADTVAVFQDPPLEATIGNNTPVSCHGGADGSATASPTGGDGAYQYMWSTGDTTATAAGLNAGNYSVTVTDGNACSVQLALTILQPDPLAANATATGETALGANDGTATAIPAGGTTPYGYLWTTGDTTAAITGLAPGNYTVTVTDANACTAIQTVTVNSFNCSLSGSISSTPVTCNGGADGSAAVSINGAADPVTYLWSNGDTTASITGLVAGVYTVEVLDANNCPAGFTVTVLQPPPLQANATATGETSLGANDGTATAAPTGGTPPYAFLWNTGDTTAQIAGLAPGSYTVTVTDLNTCTVVRTVMVNPFNCNLAVSFSVVHIACAGGNEGQATAVVSGGALPYSYLWSNGSTTATISNLQAGMYGITIHDAEGCEFISSVTITEPAPLLLSFETVPVDCPDDTTGSVTVFVSGGTAPFQFTGKLEQLSAGSYTITVTDAGGCQALGTFTIASNDSVAPVINCPSEPLNVCSDMPVEYDLPEVFDNCGLQGMVPSLVQGLPSGAAFPPGETINTYRIVDGSGNSASCSFSVIAAPSPLATVLQVTDDIGNAGIGSIDVEVSGGSGGTLTFSWSGPGGFTSESEDIDSLFGGAYVLVVTDSNGCTDSLPVLVNNTVGTGSAGNPASRYWVAPNPVSSSFRLEWEGSRPESVWIRDLHGRLLRSLDAGEWETRISVDHLSAGWYLLHIRNAAGKTVVLKWLKTE